MDVATSVMEDALDGSVREVFTLILLAFVFIGCNRFRLEESSECGELVARRSSSISMSCVFPPSALAMAGV